MKLSMGQKILTSSKLEDAIVWFRESPFHSLDFSAYVLSGQWITLIDFDEVIALYDPYFTLDWKAEETAYKLPKGSGYLLQSYIDRHSDGHSLANSIVNMKGKDLHLVVTPVSKAFIPEYDTDSDTLSPQQSAIVSKNMTTVGSLSEQFLPLLLARLLPLYLKQRGITPATISGKESICETTFTPNSHATSPDCAAPACFCFDTRAFTAHEKEQYAYWQSLQLTKESVLGVALSTSWVAKIQRVIELASVPLCVCAVTSTSHNTALHPILYANAAYGQLTGYTKSELINESSGSFWHYDRSESGQILEIQHALRTGVPLKVAVHNVRRDGRAYVNMLALRPVYKNGEYKYMISVQYDLFEGGNGRNSVANDLRRIECLLSFVADTMVM